MIFRHCITTWGEKGDLYEAVVLDINEGMRSKLLELEIKNKGTAPGGASPDRH